MKFARPLIRGRLLRRYKRFLADVELEDGAEVVAHCANPGAMTGLAEAGTAVWLEPNDDPKRKLGKDSKLTFTVPFVCYGVFRYLFLVYRKSEGGDPAKLLFRDVPLILSGALYVVTVLAVLGSAQGAG